MPHAATRTTTSCSAGSGSGSSSSRRSLGPWRIAASMTSRVLSVGGDAEARAVGAEPCAHRRGVAAEVGAEIVDDLAVLAARALGAEALELGARRVGHGEPGAGVD